MQRKIHKPRLKYMRVKAYNQEGTLVADYIFDDPQEACTFLDAMIEKGYDTEMEKINV